MKPLAWAASPPPPPPPPLLRDGRRLLPVTPVSVFLTVSSRAPEPDVRLLLSLYARVRLRLAMAAAYPDRDGISTPAGVASRTWPSMS